MPEIVTQHYAFSGWHTQLIWSEQEMADALGLTRAELRRALYDGRLVYHAHPTSNALYEYQFHEQAYVENLARWLCLQTGGHRWRWDHYYTLPDEAQQKSCWRCATCPAEKYD